MVDISVLSDVATYLAANGSGVYDPTGGTSTIFTHWMPDASPPVTPVAVLSLELYGAGPLGPFLFDATMPMTESPRIKLTARDSTPDAALARVTAAYLALIGLSDVTLGGLHYFSLRGINGPAWNGTQHSDSGVLYLYGANVQCVKTLS